MRDYHVPVSIDDPKKAFIWDLDVFILFMSGFGIGIVSRHFFISMSISLFIAWGGGASLSLASINGFFACSLLVLTH